MQVLENTADFKIPRNPIQFPKGGGPARISPCLWQEGAMRAGLVRLALAEWICPPSARSSQPPVAIRETAPARSLSSPEPVEQRNHLFIRPSCAYDLAWSPALGRADQGLAAATSGPWRRRGFRWTGLFYRRPGRLRAHWDGGRRWASQGSRQAFTGVSTMVGNVKKLPLRRVSWD